MVTKSIYKTYSNQIAKLFCKDDPNKILCEASIIQRLNTYLDDYTYPYFIAKINSGRIYITNAENFKDYGFRIVITDIITGERSTAWWELPYKYPYLSKIPGKLLQHQFNIISQNKTFTESDKSDIRITWNPLKPAYGITYVPQQVPGYTPPSITPGGGGGTGGGGQIQVIPGSNTTPIQTPDPGGIDFGSLLSNPIVLIGGGLVLYLLLKD